MEKVIFIINGKGRSGKDTVCKMAESFCKAKSISSITPILDVAIAGGWNGQKTDKARKLLSQLKELFTEFNDLSFKYCKEQISRFLESNAEVLFIHVREPEEIERLKNSIIGTPCYTLLVRRKGVSEKQFNNSSDDRVEEYKYDEIIENNGTLDKLYDAVWDLLKKYLF